MGVVESLSAQLKSKVSECFELTSIVFRLADAPEYINNDVVSYANDIDKHFANYKSHKLIVFLKELREQYNISYDAVTVASAYLDIDNGKVVVNPLVHVSKINEVDNRWSESAYKHFVSLLDDFYQKTKFREFYIQHTKLYSVAVERMDILLQKINVKWFESLFENEFFIPTVIVSLSNGEHNYAFTTPEVKDMNGIVIGSGVDSEGLPIYSLNKIPVIIHEWLHHYTNKRIEKDWEEIRLSAFKIYSYVKEDMQRNAYESPQVMINEWFTNLLSIAYVQSNPMRNFSIEHLIRGYHYKGFIWMERSVEFVGHFFKNRDRFTDLTDYMPQIVGFINYTADNFEQVLNEHINCCPYIVDVFPTLGSRFDTDVDNAIEIRFSESMFGSHGLSSHGNEDVEMIPFEGVMPSWKDDYTFVILLKKGVLKKGKKYGFQLDSIPFQSSKTYPMKSNYTYVFNTGE